MNSKELKVEKYLVKIFEDGSEEWRNEVGFFHRIDKPAIIISDLGKEWWYEGKRHRVNGAAIEYKNGDRVYYIGGVRYDEREYCKLMEKYSDIFTKDPFWVPPQEDNMQDSKEENLTPAKLKLLLQKSSGKKLQIHVWNNKGMDLFHCAVIDSNGLTIGDETGNEFNKTVHDALNLANQISLVNEKSAEAFSWLDKYFNEKTALTFIVDDVSQNPDKNAVDVAIKYCEYILNKLRLKYSEYISDQSQLNK